MTKISIVIPVYNAATYLNDCVDSIVVQDPKDIEVILVNDGSTDSSGVIADFYAQNYNYIRVFHQKNQGVSAARNLALVVARGHYLAFLDADDILYPDFLRRTFELIKEQPDIIEVNADLISEKGNILKHKIFSFEEAIIGLQYSEAAKIRLSQQAKYYICTRIIRRELVKELRFAEDISFCEDALYLTECYFQAEKIIKLDISLYGYRQHSANVTNTKTIKNISQLTELCRIVTIKIANSKDNYYQLFYSALLINLVHLRKSMYALHYKKISCDSVTLTNIKKIKYINDCSYFNLTKYANWLRRLSIVAPNTSNILILIKYYLISNNYFSNLVTNSVGKIKK